MEHGIITSVNNDAGVISCDVMAIRVQTVYPNVPMLKPHQGFVSVPEQGMLVTIESLGTSDDARFITGIIGKVSESPDQISPGDVSFSFNDGTSMRFQRGDDGNYDLTISVEGDVEINASGDIIIDGIDFSNHTHDYSWTDSAGSDTTGGPE
jgi:hypothetical protein